MSGLAVRLYIPFGAPSRGTARHAGSTPWRCSSYLHLSCRIAIPGLKAEPPPIGVFLRAHPRESPLRVVGVVSVNPQHGSRDCWKGSLTLVEPTLCIRICDGLAGRLTGGGDEVCVHSISSGTF